MFMPVHGGRVGLRDCCAAQGLAADSGSLVRVISVCIGHKPGLLKDVGSWLQPARLISTVVAVRGVLRRCIFPSAIRPRP